MSRRTHKWEYSKLILMILGIALGIVIVFTLIMVAVTSDLSPLYYIISGLFTLATTAVGFYYNKVKRENVLKLRQLYGMELTKGIDAETTVESPTIITDDGNILG